MMSGQLLNPTGAIAFWSDIGLDLLRTMESQSRLSRDTLAPVHRTVKANARRLGKRNRPT